jgi:hypothetical protein
LAYKIIFKKIKKVFYLPLSFSFLTKENLHKKLSLYFLLIQTKFFRAANAIKKEGNGTGLGLYITKEMVNLNQGEIWFQSEVAGKTIFYIKFKNC